MLLLTLNLVLRIVLAIAQLTGWQSLDDIILSVLQQIGIVWLVLGFCLYLVVATVVFFAQTPQ